jgi:hypothetical protein
MSKPFRCSVHVLFASEDCPEALFDSDSLAEAVMECHRHIKEPFKITPSDNRMVWMITDDTGDTRALIAPITPSTE